MSESIEIRLPNIGASPVRISVWFADPSELVYEGDRLVEVLIEGATFDVSAPATGRLINKFALPGDLVEFNQLLGRLEAA